MKTRILARAITSAIALTSLATVVSAGVKFR
jgi:hypothetical protein